MAPGYWHLSGSRDAQAIPRTTWKRSETLRWRVIQHTLKLVRKELQVPGHAYWLTHTGCRNPRPDGDIGDRETITNQEGGPFLLKVAIQNSKQAAALIDVAVDRILVYSYCRACGKLRRNFRLFAIFSYLRVKKLDWPSMGPKPPICHISYEKVSRRYFMTARMLTQLIVSQCSLVPRG